MIDWGRVEGFDWDEGNSRKSVDKHGVSQAEAEEVFFDDLLLVVEDESHSVREMRLHALGRSDTGRHVHAASGRHHDSGDLGSRHAQEGKAPV